MQFCLFFDSSLQSSWALQEMYPEIPNNCTVQSFFFFFPSFLCLHAKPLSLSAQISNSGDLLGMCSVINRLPPVSRRHFGFLHEGRWVCLGGTSTASQCWSPFSCSTTAPGFWYHGLYWTSLTSSCKQVASLTQPVISSSSMNSNDVKQHY